MYLRSFLSGSSISDLLYESSFSSFWILFKSSFNLNFGSLLSGLWILVTVSILEWLLGDSAELSNYKLTGLSKEFYILKISSMISLLQLSTIWAITWSRTESLAFYNCVWFTAKLSVIIVGLFTKTIKLLNIIISKRYIKSLS